MRGLLRAEGLEQAVAVDSAGTGGWHAGDPPDARAVAAARSRGIVVEGAARQVTAEDFDDFDLLLAMDRDNERDLLARAPDGEARAKVAAAARVRPGRGRRRRPRRPRPLLRRPQRLRPRAGPRRGGVPRAARRGAPRGRRVTVPGALADAVARATGAAVTGGARASGGSINEAWALRARRRRARVRQDARRRRARRVRHRGRRPALAGAGARRSRCRACSRSARTTGRASWRSSGSTRAAWTPPARRSSAAGWPRCTAPARPPSARRRPARRRARRGAARRCASASSRCPTTPPPTGRRSTRSGACSRWWRCAWRAAR